MIRNSWTVAGAVVGALLLTASLAGAQASDAKAQAELASALTVKHISLARALTSAASRGTPISAKYEYADGKLQLSVYTERAGQFFEVVVNHRTGKVAKTGKITDADDLKNAKAQSLAIAKAKRPLKSAVAKALAENAGYSAVSATATLNGGQPAAEITLLKGRAFKTVTEPLA
jgi:hypothetical protein